MKHNAKDTVVQFFDAWMMKDYAMMYSLTTITWANNYSLDYFTQMVDKWDIKDYDIIGNEINNGNTISDFMMHISINHKTLPHKIRLVHEDRPYHATKSSGIFIVKGRWGINPTTLLGLFRPDTSGDKYFNNLLNNSKNAKKGPKKG